LSISTWSNWWVRGTEELLPAIVPGTYISPT
jgi:hypothetical protein